MQHQRKREEQERAFVAAFKKKPSNTKVRPKSIFSWFSNKDSSIDHDLSVQTGLLSSNKSSSNDCKRILIQNDDDDDDDDQQDGDIYAKRYEEKTSTRSSTIGQQQMQVVEIPDRRQSHLYTPFHRNAEFLNVESEEVIDYRHSSYQQYPIIHVSDASNNNSTTSLTRSATWQPSSSTTATPLPRLLDTNNVIPTRRTSRNYSQDPEIQAKLDAVLNSEKTTYLSQLIHNNNNDSNSSNSSVYRRSTTS